MFNFDLENTEITNAVKRAGFPLFRFSKILKNFFLFLMLLSIILLGFSLLNLASSNSSVRLVALFLSLYFFFWNISLFTELKIKKPEIELTITDSVINEGNSNLAELLSFDSVKIVLDSFTFCRRKRVSIGSTALFYSALKLSKDINLICFRLGLDSKKLQADLKNYLEKIPKQDVAGVSFSEDFQKTMQSALKISSDRKHFRIEENDILVALSKEDDFFKKILVDFDLKSEDVENLTLWLDSAETSIEQNKKFWTYENLLRKGSFGKDFSSGYTITLDRYSTDWRKIVSKWMVMEVIGHAKEVEQAETILAKSNFANVLIVGDPDADRKSIIKSLADKCYLGTSLPELNNKRVV